MLRFLSNLVLAKLGRVFRFPSRAFFRVVDDLAADFSVFDYLMDDICPGCSLRYTSNSVSLERALENLEQFQLATFPDYVSPLLFKLALKSLNSCLQLLPLV